MYGAGSEFFGLGSKFMGQVQSCMEKTQRFMEQVQSFMEHIGSFKGCFRIEFGIEFRRRPERFQGQYERKR